MNKEDKKTVERVVKREKLRVLLFPIVVPSLIYGIWLSLFPSILNNYKVYTLIRELVTHWQVGGIFIILSILIIIAFKLRKRKMLIATSSILLSVWCMFTVAFILSPPPNTVWVFALTMTYLTFSLVRRV